MTSFEVARFSKPARQTISGYLPKTIFIQVDRPGIEPRFPGCNPGVFPLDQRPEICRQWPRQESNLQTRGSRPRRFAWICVLGRKWRVRKSHPSVRAYETPTNTGSPAICSISDQGENRTPTPFGTTF